MHFSDCIGPVVSCKETYPYLTYCHHICADIIVSFEQLPICIPVPDSYVLTVS